MNRGIVVGVRTASIGGFSMNGSIENQDVLKWLLYWDEIAYTGVALGGSLISGNHSQDILFLEDEGVFRTEIVDIETLGLTDLPPPVPGVKVMGLAGNQYAVAAAAARIQLSQQLSENTGNIWTVGQSGGESLILPGVGKSAELIDVQLVNCLPVPVDGTPFNDVLKFKDRYQGELYELRLALDQLRETILSSSDQRRAVDAAISQISHALTDVRAALKGAGIAQMSETISLYTANPSIGFWTAVGGASSAAAGFPVEVGLMSGVAVPTLARFLKQSIIGGQNLPKNNSDFMYVSKAIRQFSM